MGEGTYIYGVRVLAYVYCVCVCVCVWWSARGASPRRELELVGVAGEVAGFPGLRYALKRPENPRQQATLHLHHESGPDRQGPAQRALDELNDKLVEARAERLRWTQAREVARTEGDQQESRRLAELVLEAL